MMISNISNPHAGSFLHLEIKVQVIDRVVLSRSVTMHPVRFMIFLGCVNVQVYDHLV